jgi:F0F1-type ATP synthase gamma subunit
MMHSRFIPVVSSTWKVEIGKIKVQGQSGHKGIKTASQQQQQQKAGVVVCTCNSSFAGGISRRITVQAGPCEKQETITEKRKAKRTGGDSPA